MLQICESVYFILAGQIREGNEKANVAKIMNIIGPILTGLGMLGFLIWLATYWFWW